MTMISTKEAARRLGKTPQAVTKAAREGRFGDTAKRGERGEWLLDWPAAADELRQNTDPTRTGVVVPAPAAPSTPRVTYEGPNGRCEIPLEVYKTILLAEAQPEADVLTEEAQAALTRILCVMGIIDLDGKPTPGHETAPEVQP